LEAQQYKFPTSILLYPPGSVLDEKSFRVAVPETAPLPVFVCHPPKTGSTTLRSWVLHAYGDTTLWDSGEEDLVTFGDAFAHVAKKWGVLSSETGLIHRVLKVAGKEGVPISSSIAIIRDPLERFQSAYTNKLACGSHDVGVDTLDRERMLGLLRESAAKYELPGLALLANQPCLSPADAVQLLVYANQTFDAEGYDTSHNDNTDGKSCLETHFEPWTSTCRFDAIDYDVLVPIENTQKLVQSLQVKFGLPGITDFEILHSTVHKKDVFTEEQKAIIRNVYRADYEMMRTKPISSGDIVLP